MEQISLDGPWKLYHQRQNTQAVASLEQFRELGLTAIEAIVPGNVELDLVRNDRLPEPFFAQNIHLLRPLEAHEWWYEREFSTPTGLAGRRVELVLHGVDCLATYWLNGEKIGESENMFIEQRFDITALLEQDRHNELVVHLRSAIQEAATKEYSPGVQAMQSNWVQLWLRKAAHSFAWDIMPRAVSAGLWRSVELQIEETNAITDLYLATRALHDASVTLSVFYQLQLDPEVNITDNLYFYLTATCGTSTFESRQRVQFRVGSFTIEVPEPQLWWPRGYGEANLYDVTVALVQNGVTLASRHETIGIREVAIKRTPTTRSDDIGEFLVEVNHVPIFCKGSNWVPLDAFHSRDRERYERAIELFVDLNCNILRCWGGNVYEDHALFDLCDRNGIMVWQDFAMACAAYPQTASFHETIRTEAISVVRKLRNHASLILWCGDNEVDQLMMGWGLDPNTNRITREVLPQVLAQHDPYRHYLPSSPYYAPEVIATRDERLMPEAHLWGPRDYYKSRYYTETTAHFVSEIGYHGCPDVASIRQFIDQEHLWPWQDNEQWITHCSDPVGEEGRWAYRIKLMADQIFELFGENPQSLEDFILASQISQAEAKKFFIEMMRLKKWRRTGIIWWNMLDGWPQFSDAVVDYYFAKKLAYHYIKRVQHPICIMIDEPERWHVAVVVGNDSRQDGRGTFLVTDADSGATLLGGDFAVPANGTRTLGRIRVSHGEQRMFLIKWSIDDQHYHNHYLLGSPPFSFARYKHWLEVIGQ